MTPDEPYLSRASCPWLPIEAETARKYRFRKLQAGSPARREVLSCIMPGRDDTPSRRTLPAPIRSVAYFRNRYFPAISAVGGCTRSLRRKGAAIGGNFPCWPIGLRRGLPFRENRKGKARLRHRSQAQAGNGVANRGDSCRNPRAAGCSCGKVTHGIAKAFAESEFDRYRVTRDRLCESDFDKTAQLAIFGDRDAAEGLEGGEWRRVPSATLYANLTRPALRSLSGCFTMSRNGWNVPREPPR